jgi:6-phosphogluconolactonase
MEIEVFQTLDELSRDAARRFVAVAGDAIETRGRFSVSLSGGNTPMKLYELLADEFSDAVDWNSVAFFIGDERNVPLDDGQSNYRNIKAALFDPLGISPTNIFHWDTDLGERSMITSEFETMILDYFEGPPRFDLTLLGLGEDGHTASLFPGSDALKEDRRFVAYGAAADPDETRFTLTFPAINNSRNIIFLVAGEGKTTAAAEVFGPERELSALPAARIQPTDGTLTVLIDDAAAAGLGIP